MQRHLRSLIPLALVIVLAACGARATTTPAGLTGTPPALAENVVPGCALTPVVVPTVPAAIPGYVQLDPTTNLHVTGTMQQLDVKSWRLAITGKVERPLALTYDELRCLPRIESQLLLVCPGFFQDEARWAGAPLAEVLALAVMHSDARGIRLKSADGYTAPVTLEQALDPGSFLAYEWEGEPLPILHGFPLRAVFPPLDGNTWVKWLIEIEVF